MLASLALLAPFVFVQGPVSGLTQSSILRAPGENALGLEVAISNDTVAAVSAHLGGERVHLFGRRGSGWVEEASFDVDQTLGHGSGALDIDGPIVVKGSTTSVFPTAGMVDVFARYGSTWRREAVLVPTDAVWGDNFGGALALDGNRLLVGARMDSSPSTLHHGSAYVFERSGTDWAQTAKIVGPMTHWGQFGLGVALDGTTAVIAGVTSGVHVHELRGSTWSKAARLEPGSPTANLGISVAVSGNTILVGAPLEGANREGAVYVFVRDRSGWREDQRVVVPSSGVRTKWMFGREVSLSGNRALVSSGHHIYGAVHLLERSGGIWSEVDEYWNYQNAQWPGNTLYVTFGNSIDLEGDLAVAGELGPNWTQEGAVHVFDVGP